MSSDASGSRDGCNQGGGNPNSKKGKNKRPVMKMEEEKTEEKCETITLKQTGGKPNQKLVEEFTQAFQSATVKWVCLEIQVQRNTSTKKTIVERSRLDTIAKEHLNRIEDYNLARRIGCEWEDVPPEMSEVKKDRKRLNTVPVYRDPDQQEDYVPIPMQVEVVPYNGTGAEQLSGCFPVS